MANGHAVDRKRSRGFLIRVGEVYPNAPPVGAAVHALGLDESQNVLDTPRRDTRPELNRLRIAPGFDTGPPR